MYLRIDNDFDPKEAVTRSFKATLQTRLDRAAVKGRVIATLQAMNYTPVELALKNTFDLLIYTRDYIYHPLLSAGVYSRPPGDCKRERQLAVEIWLHDGKTTGQSTEWQLDIIPWVQMRCRREGGPFWQRDPDETQTSKAACAEIVDKLQSAISALEGASDGPNSPWCKPFWASWSGRRT
jgi:hypothetical protein